MTTRAPTGAPVVLILVDKNHIHHALNDSERMYGPGLYHKLGLRPILFLRPYYSHNYWWAKYFSVKSHHAQYQVSSFLCLTFETVHVSENWPDLIPSIAVVRGGICPCRQCRRQCKIFASGVNFSRNNAVCYINESKKLHFILISSLKLLTYY